MRYCAACGALCGDDFVFCRNCGARLAPPTSGPPASGQESRFLGLKWGGGGYLRRGRPYTKDEIQRDLRLRVPGVVFTIVGAAILLYVLLGYDLTLSWGSSVSESMSMLDIAEEGFETSLLTNEYFWALLATCAILAVAGAVLAPSSLTAWSAVPALALVYAGDCVYAYLIGTGERIALSIDTASLAVAIALVAASLVFSLIGWIMSRRYCAARFATDPGAKKSAFQYWFSAGPEVRRAPAPTL